MFNFNNALRSSNGVKLKIIQVLGTSSGAGKSTIAMALCRIISDMGIKVSPFKAVNMSLNSVAIADGSEIARAQYVQAYAARTEPLNLMNPILLKPEGGISSQVIVLGKSRGKMEIPEYYEFIKNEGSGIIKDSLKKLAEDNDAVIAEGAGSPAEINILDRDYANTYVSKIFKTPALLVSDIERGGAFASLYGTLKLMPDSDLVRWIMINRMRGDKGLLADGIKKIESITGKKLVGIIPYYDGYIPGEDSLDYLKDQYPNEDVAVIKYPFMENYSDVDILNMSGNGFINITERNKEKILDAKLIILPGSKNVAEDLKYLRRNRMDDLIAEAHRRGSRILGICGGYQMLGHFINDNKETLRGLGLLDVDTEYSSNKTVRRVEYSLDNSHIKSRKYSGYEIHYGTVINRGEEPLNITGSGKEGSISKDGSIIGTNVHGILENADLSRYLTGKAIRPMDRYLEDNIAKFSRIFKENTDLSEIIEYILK